MDGHPAWSSDDSQIAFGSFWEANGQSEIVIIDSNTGAELNNLKPDGISDNDPEYLPDGRIVFKTDHFSILPQVRIAVMSADGSNAQQISTVNNASDHDPVGNNMFVLFERFPKDTPFETDSEAAFINWNIIEAALNGSGEQTLLSDGWINWLPVYDPNGQYIAYLKSSGYTSAYLMARTGNESGRLIPGITQMRYLDWK